MNYHNITHDDMLNGSGLRVVLWVSGCEHHCRGCQNQQTWPVSSGIPFDSDAMSEIRQSVAQDYCAGITLSGGDPLHPANIETVTMIVSALREEFPDKTIWLYTGSSFENVLDLPVVRMVDVLVDGEYKEDLRDVNAPWVGSTNQRVIDVKKSIAAGQAVLWSYKEK